MAKGFQKGKSGNPNGKPVGTKSAKTLEWEEFGKELIANGLPRAIEILQTCDDDKFIAQFSNLLEYFKPKLARSEVKHEGEQKLTVTFLENDGA